MVDYTAIGVFLLTFTEFDSIQNFIMTDTAAFREMLKGNDPVAKRGACEAIEGLRLPEYIPDLVEAAKDEDLGVREAALNALSAIGTSEVAEAIVPLVRSEDVSIRNAGLEVLEHVGLDAFNTLSGLLKDNEDDVVKFAIDTIATVRDTRFEREMRSLLTHANANIRSAAAVCLGKTGASGSVTALIKALGDREEWVRFSVVEALGLAGGGSALEPLFEIIERDTALVKEAAFEAIGRIAGPADSVPALLKAEVLLSRGQILSPGAVVALLEKAFMPGSSFNPPQEFRQTFLRFFSGVLEEPYSYAQFKASLKGVALLQLPDGLRTVLKFANSLHEIDEEMEEFLVDLIVSFEGHCPLSDVLTAEVKQGCKILKLIARALGRVKSAQSVFLLDVLMHGSSKEETREIVSALSAIGTKEAVEVLFRILKDKDGHARKTAAKALSRIAGVNAVSALFDALKSEVYRDVMEEISDAISDLNGDDVKDSFAAMLASQRPALREMAIRGLGRLCSVDVFPYISPAMSDENPEVRKATYRALAGLNLPYTVPDVLKGLKDKDPEVRLAVLKVVSGFVGTDVIEAVSEALDDDNVWVRYYAVLHIAGAADKDSFLADKITRMLEEDSAPVKAACARALARIGSRASLKTLEKFKNHADTDVRSAVERAIETLSC
ncbi:hypothetical protein EPN18_09395 [bacterium]|nr:MAG: hypothetical protein EPN18_09395 [bacterium]